MLTKIISNTNKSYPLRTIIRKWLKQSPSLAELNELTLELAIEPRDLLAWVNEHDHRYLAGCTTTHVALENKKKTEKKNKLRRIKAAGVHKYANRSFSRALKHPEFDPGVFIRAES